MTNSNILTLNYEYPPLGGGAAPVTKNLAEKFVEQGHHVDVVTMGFDDLPRTEIKNGVTVHRVPCLRSSQSMSKTHEMLSYLPPAFFQARQLIQKHDYDIIHTHFILPTGLLALALKNIYDLPYVITPHGSDVPGYNPDRFGLLHQGLLPVWKQVVKNASTIISPSAYLADLIHKKYSDASIEVIPNGFNVDKFNTDISKQERILITSRLFKRKGIQYFLDAIKEPNIDWEIVITGEGPYKEELRKKAEETNKNVKFLGWVERSRLERLLESSAIYIFPSSHENCPVSLQEGMAAGCAVIASKYSGTGEVIGDAGIRINPKNKTEFGNAISEVINNTTVRSELQKASKERIHDTYRWDIIVDQYTSVFTDTY